jgi:lysophospholipase L1-like esterase
MDVVYVADRDSAGFAATADAVDIVCAGDSLTGWNNFGPVAEWPYVTYPSFLQQLCDPRDLRVANGGIAGEISDNGPQQIRDYLDLFPRARLFLFGMGTNDLGTWPDTESVSGRIIENLRQMVQLVEERGKRPVLFNVPHVNERMFPAAMARDIRAKRDYHNPRLSEFCQRQALPLSDICRLLRDEHFGDALHPNSRGARIIAEAVFRLLSCP